MNAGGFELAQYLLSKTEGARARNGKRCAVSLGTSAGLVLPTSLMNHSSHSDVPKEGMNQSYGLEKTLPLA